MLCQLRSVVLPAVAVATFLLVACSSTQAAGPSVGPTESPTPTPTPVVTPVPPSPQLTEADISAALAKWKAAGIASYSYKLDVLCFCLFEHGLPIAVEVVNGETKSMTWADGTARTEPGLSTSTIDRLFAWLIDVRKTAYSVLGTFDLVSGYPTTVSVDFDPLLADEEIGYRIRDLQVTAPNLPRTGGHP